MELGQRYTVAGLQALFEETYDGWVDGDHAPIKGVGNVWKVAVKNSVRMSPDRPDYRDNSWSELRGEKVGSNYEYWIDTFQGQVQDEVTYLLREAEEIDAKEGGIRYVRHRVIERSHRLRDEKIRIAMEKNNNSVPCEGCGLDMLARYSFSEPVIDCHHLLPLSKLEGEERKTTLDDLVLLCPSCHRAIHKQDNCSDMDELRRRLSIN